MSNLYMRRWSTHVQSVINSFQRGLVLKDISSLYMNKWSTPVQSVINSFQKSLILKDISNLYMHIFAVLHVMWWYDISLYYMHIFLEALYYFVAFLVMIFADLHVILLYSHSSSLRELLKLLCYFDICYWHFCDSLCMFMIMTYN